MPTNTIKRWKSQVGPLSGPSINRSSAEQMAEIDPDTVKAFKEENAPKEEEQVPSDSSFVIVRGGKKYYFSGKSGERAAKSLALPKSVPAVIDSTLDAYSIKPKK